MADYFHRDRIDNICLGNAVEELDARLEKKNCIRYSTSGFSSGKTHLQACHALSDSESLSKSLLDVMDT
jgi:hypothetical protein